jgi:hypothetical protein
MKKNLACLVCLSFAAAVAATYYQSEKPAVAAESSSVADKQLGHMVFFTLKERSPEQRQKLVGLCKKYLVDHPGTVYFSVGSIAEDLDREVNVRDFDVALHLVFKNKKFHDEYQVAPRHLSFVEEGKPLWEKVRVFDSYLQ